MKRQEIQSFGEVFNGKTPSKEEQRSSGRPILKIRDIDETGRFRGVFESFVDDAFYNRHAKKKLKTGDTIILNAAHNADYVGSKNAHVPDELNGVIATGEWLIVRVKEANSNYVNHYLKSPTGRKSLKNCVKGIHLYPKDVKRILVPLPPLDDQIRIAHLLGKVEGLIAQRKQHLQQLDALLKSVFLEMFGNPVRNEKGWDVDRIGRSIKVQGGFAFKSMDISSTGAIKLVKIANVHFENLTWDDVSYVPDSFIDVYKKFALEEGDLLVALTRPVIKSLNVVKTATVRNEDLPCLLNQRVARFLINPNQINKRFFLQYCYTEFFRNTVEGLCPPGLQPNVSTNQIEDIPIFYPPVSLQNEFAVIAEKVEGIKSRYQQSLTDLETLYGALSQQAFKGELDLSRVPLLGIDPEKEKTVAAEPLQTPAEQSLAIHLPDTDSLLAALESAEARKNLLAEWLEAYRGQLVTTPFSVRHFMAAAQTRLAELHPDNDFELGANDYEHIKTWVFNALAAGTLTQAFDDAGNRIELKAPTENNPA